MLLGLAVLTGRLTAQPDSVLLTKNFKFRDGVYLSLEDWQSDRPAYTWEDLSADLATNPQTFMTQVDYIRVREDGRELPLDSLWGLSLGGIPYIRLDRDSVSKEAVTFAGLRVRGKISYFSYANEVTRQVKITAYNPLTGRPFRSGMVDRKETVEVERMLDFQTGQVLEFNPENFLGWIQDDPQLQRTILELTPDERQEKLFRCLLIYVDRNAVYLRR